MSLTIGRLPLIAKFVAPDSSPPGGSLLEQAKKGLGSLIPGLKSDTIDIHLAGDDYKNISRPDASRMIGYFTSKLRDQGFPWSLHNCQVDDGKVQAGKPMSEMEALSALGSGQPVLFQPMRDLQLDLSSDSLSALAAAGSLGSGSLTSVGKVADFSKNTQVSPGSQGVELKFGAPTVVGSYAQLKLLYQMYNPDEKIDDADRVSKAAHQLSYFTKETMGTAYPWRFFKESDGSRFWRVVKAAVPGAVNGALVGGAIGGLLGVPLGLFTRNWDLTKTLLTYGAMIGGAYQGIDRGRIATKGDGINAVEALERVLDGQPVVFQETQMRSVGVPILGKISWFSDHGKGSSIQNTDELDTFYWMQNQNQPLPGQDDARPDDPPADDGSSKVVIIDNRTYLGDNRRIDVRDLRKPIVLLPNGADAADVDPAARGK